MPLNSAAVDELMGCECEFGTIKPIDFDITGNTVKVILICDQCGKMVALSSEINRVSDVELVENVRSNNEFGVDCE